MVLLHGLEHRVYLTPGNVMANYWGPYTEFIPAEQEGYTVYCAIF